MSEASWWLLVVGLVVGAGLMWLVLADSSRRDADVLEAELPSEAAWIAATLRDAGRPMDAATAEEVLRLHRAYLAAPPPDEPDPEALARAVTPSTATTDAPAEPEPNAAPDQDPTSEARASDGEAAPESGPAPVPGTPRGTPHEAARHGTAPHEAASHQTAPH